MRASARGRAAPEAAWTLIVVGAHARGVRTIRISRRSLRSGGIALGCLALTLVLAGGHYLSLIAGGSRSAAVERENAQLRSQMHVVQDHTFVYAYTKRSVVRG